MKKFIIIFSVAIGAFIILACVFLQSDHEIENRITMAEDDAVILENKEAELYGVFPSEDVQFGLYKQTLEIDHNLLISLYAITEYDENGERINRTWIESNESDCRNYKVDTQILSQNIQDGYISAIGIYTVSYRNEEQFKNHIYFVMNSLFEAR